MTRRERVLAAISHRQTDRVPKGELGIDPILRDKLVADTLPKDASVFEKELQVRRILDMDLISIHEYPMMKLKAADSGYTVFRGAYGEEFADNGKTTRLLKKAVEDMEEFTGYELPQEPVYTTRELDYMKEHSDLFCMTQINGPVAALTWMQGLEDLFETCMTCLDTVVCVANQVMDYEIMRAKCFLDHGADAILMGEDIAWNRGLLFPPYVMDELGWPIYGRMIRQIKAYKNVPVIMHSDGDINLALEKIISCGFDGVQSLQPSANMDIANIKQAYGDRLCLMGNLDLNELLPFGSPEEVALETRRLIDVCAPGGGFILSSCNILTDVVPPENALAMYLTARDYRP